MSKRFKPGYGVRVGSVRDGMVKAIRQRGWTRRLLAALKHGSFTQTDVALAQQWPSCALGEAALYRGRDVSELRKADSFLSGRGREFYSAVSKNNVRYAILVRDSIRRYVRNRFPVVRK